MQAVHPSGQPVYLTTLNAHAAITTGAAYLQNGSTGFALTGSGHHIFQWDAGAVQPHIEFGNRVVANEGATTDRHATHVAGTLIAAGVNPQAKGMAPEAMLHAYYFDDDLYKMATQSEKNEYGFLISNHSYGITTGWNKVSGVWQWFGDVSISSDEDYTAGFYTPRTKQIDDIAYLSPYHTIVWAAGNDRADAGDGSHPRDCNGGTGYDCIIQQGVAKNIITVGAVDQVLNYTGPSSVPMSFFSSWGPTDDGRIKPDLVGDGLSVLSTTNTGVDQYTTLGGTSMATPNVAGSLLLLQDLYSKLNGGLYMRASTLKALAIHTTKETGTAPGPDYSFGWGLLDVDAAAHVLSGRDDINTFVVEGELINDDMHAWILNPQANQKITATLVWTDPAGLPPSAALDPPYKMLVNDLDLRLSDASGATQYPWVLDPGNPSGAAIHSDNTRDNVEKLEFNLPDLKPYTLKLSHKGYLLNGSQHYSLIITYRSTNASKTLYWIGGSGNWSDPAHWSLNSGGSPANTVPSSSDQVIMDENSFSGSGEIQLSGNAACNTLRWYCTKDVGLNFNNKTLTLAHELTLAAKTFKKLGNGSFVLSTSSTGIINGYETITEPNLTIASGDWLMHGNPSIDSLIITGGSLTTESASLSINHFTALGVGAKFYPTRSQIRVHESWKSDQSKTDIKSTESTLIIEGTVSMQAIDLIWNGSLVNQGTWQLAGKISVDSLFCDGGSTLDIANENSLSIIKGLSINSKLGFPVIISSTGAATIKTEFHKKICIESTTVVNVALTGNAVIGGNVGCIFQNAAGWFSQDCNQILFPDFNTKYACQNALTQFTNTSTGSGSSYHWNFGDSNSTENESTEENPIHQFTSTGHYTVTLTVSDGTTTSSYSKVIDVATNSLPETTIEHNAEILFSSAEGTQYQWFESGQAISGETNRVFAYGGVEGLYRVVLYDGQCNRPSEEFTISGVPDQESLQVYPNPASGKIYFSITGIEQIKLLDLLGRSMNAPSNLTENSIDVSSISSGIYVLELRKQNMTWKRKVMVQK